MFLSRLIVDIGDNPDRPRPGRLWLRNRYHVHQRLCIAFPSDVRKMSDPEFLAPYKPEDFPEQRNLACRKKADVDIDTLKQVHSQRNHEAGFLFRIDPLPNGRAMILVQSAVQPDWEYAFQNAEYLLAAPLQQPRPLQISIERGEIFRFRLMTNPTKKILTIPKKRWDDMSEEERKENKTRHGQRVPVPSFHEIDEWRADHPGEDPRAFIHEKLIDWLLQWRPMKDGKPAESAGFTVDSESTLVQPGYVYINKEGKGHGKRLRSACYDGILTVDDPEIFKETLVTGIGPAKGFGFGLLSLARR